MARDILRIDIDLSGAAFEGDPAPETARILGDLAGRLGREVGAWSWMAGEGPLKIRDANGNTCGTAAVLRVP